ncbi:MAG: tetratricopeptide repeat protein [bacterium]
MDKNKDNKIYDEEIVTEKGIKKLLKRKTATEAVNKLKNLMKIEKYNQTPFFHKLLGEYLEKANKYGEAVREYERAIRLDPKGQNNNRQKGFSFYKKGDYLRALPYLKEEFKNDPEDYYIRSVLFKIFKKLKKEKDGINFFREIIKDNPGFNELWEIIKRLSHEDGIIGN